MGERKMGGYWSTEEERQVSALREKQRLEKEISEMRPTCKSHTDDKLATFAKRKKMAFGGLV